MDIDMPVMAGIEATRRAMIKYPDLKIIGLSYHEDFQNMQDLLMAGASNYVFKNKLDQNGIKDLISKVVIK